MNIDVQTVTTGATPYLKIDIQIDRSELSISETQMGTRLRLKTGRELERQMGRTFLARLSPLRCLYTHLRSL